MPKYEGKQNVSIVREKERRRNTPGTRVGTDCLLGGGWQCSAQPSK